ncbi:MAG TPA: DNA methyltransferase [Chloroflexia bacterium]|nr:DNA methyltransferase [Chloroflexia bacterium]
MPDPEAPPGRLDPRNRLNDLTGREWVYFLQSVQATAYPVRGPQSYGHNLRRAHPSPKPPQLMAEIIRFFTKADGWVLDPFAGVGGTLLGCALAGRHGVGVDLSPEYLAIYQQVCAQEGLAAQTTVCADARTLADQPAVTGRLFDLVLTDPPYGDMLSRPQEGEKKKRTGSAAPTPFSARPEDLGNLPYADFLTALAAILGGAVAYLKPGGYLVVFAKDLQPTATHHNLLHADLAACLPAAIPGLRFRGYKIWVDQTTRLYPFGYPFQFVANQLHQYILVFQIGV